MLWLAGAREFFMFYETYVPSLHLANKVNVRGLILVYIMYINLANERAFYGAVKKGG